MNMMEKIYQIFVSSTYEDLVEERKAVKESILKAGHLPVGMEMFSASNDEQFEYIKRMIDKCDYYVLIVAGRYGSVNSEIGKSFTEQEYEYALEKKMPILSFLHTDPENLPKEKREDDKKAELKSFRDKVTKCKMCDRWSNMTDLISAVISSLNEATKTHPQKGWIRGTISQVGEYLINTQENTLPIEVKNISTNEKTKMLVSDCVIMGRGDTNFDQLVDATLYIPSNQLTLREIENELKNSLNKYKPLPIKYFYMPAVSWDNWLGLCRDAEYKNDYMNDSLKLFQEQSKNIVEKVFETIGKIEGIDYISLGPGDGLKDIFLLREFIDKIENDEDKEIYYYPYDISLPNIENTIRNVYNDDDFNREKLKIKAILIDFAQLADAEAIYKYRPETNIFGLLGNTIGNVEDEIIFLTQLHEDIMLKDDLLILEIRTNTNEDSQFKSDAYKRFDFSPLKLLQIKYEKEKLRYERGRKNLSKIPNTSTTVVKYINPVYYNSNRYRK